MRKYKKAHLCKHIRHTGNVLVFVKDSCPAKHPKFGYVDKSTCKECENFEEVSKNEN